MQKRCKFGFGKSLCYLSDAMYSQLKGSPFCKADADKKQNNILLTNLKD
jgi:hypothetical protein